MLGPPGGNKVVAADSVAELAVLPIPATPRKTTPPISRSPFFKSPSDRRWPTNIRFPELAYSWVWGDVAGSASLWVALLATAAAVLLLAAAAAGAGAFVVGPEPRRNVVQLYREVLWPATS